MDNSLKIERPLDLLNNSKGKNILVYLKDNEKVSGILLAFDIHINLVIDNTRIITNEAKTPDYKEKNIGISFLRGDTIILISPGEK